ncbi:hypothetical protein LCIT_06360 [Leuconostoc citreum]|uniref:Uncharacterized protein n=1 Tax=Leuconostoc citreum TaxID=33964 RepID=A0A5A5U0Y5_LEUCI|nr:hypothetical protein LCIT_06360 [Leuconostoc citreum]
MVKIKLNSREAEILKYIIQSYNELEGEYLDLGNVRSREIKMFVYRIQLNHLVSVRDYFEHSV